jgi:hypothetical protein
MRDRIAAYRVSVRKPDEKRPRRRPGRRWRNIKINLQEIGWGHGLD